MYTNYRWVWTIKKTLDCMFSFPSLIFIKIDKTMRCGQGTGRDFEQEKEDQDVQIDPLPAHLQPPQQQQQFVPQQQFAPRQQLQFAPQQQFAPEQHRAPRVSPGTRTKMARLTLCLPTSSSSGSSSSSSRLLSSPSSSGSSSSSSSPDSKISIIVSSRMLCSNWFFYFSFTLITIYITIYITISITIDCHCALS